jgi:hypothetical protein
LRASLTDNSSRSSADRTDGTPTAASPAYPPRAG